jgi:hypothetical protein
MKTVADAADESHLVGVAELAAMLGVTRSEVRRLTRSAWRLHGIAYTKVAPGVYRWPLESLMVAIMAEAVPS